MNPIEFIFRLIGWFIRLFDLLLIVYCLMSWFVSPVNRFRLLLSRLMDPLLEPFRKLQRQLLGNRLPIDLSPIIALFAINLAQSALSLLGGLFRF